MAPGNVSPPLLLYVLQLAATLFMTGLIWFVQVVHYPLFRFVGAEAFLDYERLHAQRTGWVVGPPMVIELGTALAALLPALRPDQLSRSAAITSAILAGVIWLSTALFQIPLHNLLDRAPTPGAMHRLVLTNWIRTLAWTTRSCLLLYILWTMLSRSHAV